MRDVAARARVSVATVSKSLRGTGSIPAHTREAVVKIAEQMNYRPHPYVSALMQTRRRRQGATEQRPTLAFLTAFPAADTWQKSASPLMRLLHAGAEEQAEQRGYQLTHFWLFRDGMNNHRFSEMLRARGVRGLLLTPLPALGLQMDLTWSYFSVVAHGLSIAHPVFHRTSNDHYQSMQLALESCRRSGYQRPGFAMDGLLNQRLEQRWEASFHIARTRLGYDPGVASYLYEQWDPEAMRKWIRREKPDVVVTLLATEQIAQLREKGVRIPAEVGLISLSIHDWGGALSGIYQNAKLMGSVAADKLIDLVERNETGIPENPLTLTMEGRWNPGRTIRAPREFIAPDPHTL